MTTKRTTGRTVTRTVERTVGFPGSSGGGGAYLVSDFEAEGITVATFEAGGNTDVANFEANGYIAASQVFLIDEDFEETGTPSVGTWISTSTPDYDSTSHSVLTDEALLVQNGDGAAVNFTASTNVYFKADYQGNVIASITKLLFIYRPGPGVSGTIGHGIVEDSSEHVATYVNLSIGTYSSNFVMQTGTKYYLWLDYIANGSCYAGISTTDSKPTSGTDTTTAWADVDTDTGGASMANLQMGNMLSDHWSDNWKIAETEI